MKRFVLGWSLAASLVLSSAGLVQADPPKVPKAVGGASPARPPIAPLTAAEIANRVQAFYDRTKTYRAGFRQRYVIEMHDRTIDSQGSVVFEKPGKMSWRYDNNGNRVVSDGKIIRIYEKENKQMYEQPLEKSQYPAVLSFLTGGGNLQDTFKLTKLDARQMKVEGAHVLLGEPKEPSPAYQKVFLYIDAATYQVRRVVLLDAQRNRNRFDFVNPEVNVKALSSEFAFVPPKGTQVIRP